MQWWLNDSLHHKQRCKEVMQKLRKGMKYLTDVCGCEYKWYPDVGFPSVSYEDVLLPLVTEEAVLANGRQEIWTEV